MTAHTQTGDKVMMDLADFATDGMDDTLKQKKIKTGNVEEEIDDLKNLSKGKRGDEADHKQRMQDAKNKLEALEKTHSQTLEKKPALKDQVTKAKETKPPPVTPSSTTPTESKFRNNHTNSIHLH